MKDAKNKILEIQNHLSMPDKKMAELCGLQPFTYSKCKSDKAIGNKFSQQHLDRLKINLIELFDSLKLK